MDASVPFGEIRGSMLQDDELATLYLDRALAENELDRIKQVLGHLAQARVGGMERFLERIGLSRKQLNGVLAGEGIQSKDALEKIHRALDLDPSETQKTVTRRRVRTNNGPRSVVVVSM